MSYVAECEQCGTIERGDLETVGDVADDHETFHDVRISRVVTDGGRPHANTNCYVLDEDRTAVIEYPFQSKRRISVEAEVCGPNHIVATETALKLIEITSDHTLRWSWSSPHRMSGVCRREVLSPVPFAIALRAI